MSKLAFLTFEDLIEQFFDRPEAEEELLRRYDTQAAILVVDFTDMVKRTDAEGIVYALALARAAERALQPAVQIHNGEVVKRVADTFFAVFKTPESALFAALDGMARMEAFNIARTGVVGDGSRNDPIHACVGLGFGRTLVVPGQDMYGEEVNRAFVLGEDVAEAQELLASSAFLANCRLPEGVGAHAAAADRVQECGFEFHVIQDHRTR